MLVYGAVDEAASCRFALRRWLARRAKETLMPWLESVLADSDLRFTRLTIKNQRTRWASCSVDACISLNAKLLFLAPELVRYVMLHELCHTLERNHTRRFWSHLRQFEPRTNLLQGQMRDAWKHVPEWSYSRPVERPRARHSPLLVAE